MTINNSKASSNQQGFTLVELIIAMIVISVLAGIYLPNLQVDVKNTRIKAVVNELSIIANAAQNYASLDQSKIDTAASSTYAFPDALNQCRNAITTMASAGFIVGISATSTWFDEVFTTSCSTQTFSVGLRTDDSYAYRIKNTLGSVKVNNDVATYTVPKPSLLPIIDDYIALLSGSTDTWNAQSKTIANVADVSYTFGKKASQAVYEAGLVCDSIICFDDISNEITQPNCPTNSTPTLFITGVSRWGGATIDNWDYGITSNSNVWTVDFVVGGSNASTQTLWSYVTKCG